MRLLFLLILLPILLASCNLRCDNGEIRARLDATSFCVQVVDTPELRAEGLMNKTLEPRTGMLFVFPDSGIRTFWMKDMRMALAVIYLNENKSVIDLHMAEPCTSGICDLYVSAAPARYVLELEPGFAEELRISPGDIVHFDYET